MEDELVVIFGTEIEIEAILCHEMLQSHGIGVIERRNLSDAYGVGLIFPLSGAPSFELLVRRNDAEQAAHLVEQFMAESAESQTQNDKTSEE